MPSGQSSIVIPSACFLLKLNKALMRFRFCDFGKSRERLKAKRGCERRKILESHNRLNQVDFLAFLERYDRLFPMWLAAEISPAFALFLSGIVARVHRYNLLIKET